VVVSFRFLNAGNSRNSFHAIRFSNMVSMSVRNLDPLLLGCDGKEDCLTALCSKFCYGKCCVSSKIASVKGKGTP
jgi:hypothetical protein